MEMLLVITVHNPIDVKFLLFGLRQDFLSLTFALINAVTMTNIIVEFK